MAEQTMFWTTNGTGDGASSGYTQSQWQEFLRDMFMGDRTSQGVVGAFSSISDNLQITGTASPLSLASGRAMVYGIPYRNTAALNLTVSTPAADTGGRVILRAGWAAQTVRAVVLMNTSGVTAAPALTQSAGVTWEISLCSFVIDTSGDIWTDATKLSAGVTDERDFVQYNTKLVAARQGGGPDWNTAGATNRIAGPAAIQVGTIEWTGGAAASGTIDVTFPDEFVVKPLVFGECYENQPDINLVISAIATTGMTIAWKDAAGGTHTSLDFGWMAIGRF